MIIHDLRCTKCEKIYTDEMCVYPEWGTCECGAPRKPLPAAPMIDIWGSSQYIDSLDMEFGTKDEMRKHMKENGLSQAPQADKHHGARNEEGLELGKIYGYAGQKRH